MTRLVWGAPGERFYEAGADRGVLYVPGLDGVPWNGLISVNETPTGGAPTPYYVDGYKYANLASAEEFEATIQAFSAPAEFAVCDGTKMINNGLFATQQPRKQFNLTYRTRIGNDLEGLEHAYKIHLVYNAMADPSDQNNSTLDKSISPINKTWRITTQPPMTPGIRPTSHFVVDTRLTPPEILAQLEDILYGTMVGQPQMPTVTELRALFEV